MRLHEVLLNSDITFRELSEDEKKKLQTELVEMLKDIISVCEKHNLVVFLGGGSCLGAVRHKGFIPWDDDLDLNMPRDSYRLFPEALKAEFPEKYHVTGPGFSGSGKFVKVRKTGTVYETFFDDPDVDNAIGIDIFPMDYVPEKKSIRLFHGMHSMMLSFIVSCTRFYQSPSPAEQYLSHYKETRVKMAFRKVVGFIFSWRPYEKWQVLFDRQVSSVKKSDLVTFASGRKRYFGEIHPESVFLPLSDGVFEGVPVKLPHQPEVYLTKLYGPTYMQLPPEEKREKHFITCIDFGTES